MKVLNYTEPSLEVTTPHKVLIFVCLVSYVLASFGVLSHFRHVPLLYTALAIINAVHLFVVFAHPNVRNFVWKITIKDDGLLVKTSFVKGEQFIPWNRIRSIKTSHIWMFQSAHVVETADQRIAIPLYLDPDRRLSDLIARHTSANPSQDALFTEVSPLFMTCVTTFVVVVTILLCAGGFLCMWQGSVAGLVLIVSGLGYLWYQSLFAKQVIVKATGLTVISRLGFTWEIPFDNIESISREQTPHPVYMTVKGHPHQVIFDWRFAGVEQLRSLVLQNKGWEPKPQETTSLVRLSRDLHRR